MAKKSKFKIRKPSNFKIVSNSYFVEKTSEQESINIYHDPRLSPGRLDGGRIRAVLFNDNLTPILQ